MFLVLDAIPFCEDCDDDFRDEDDSFSRGDTYTSWSVNGIWLSSDDCADGLKADFDVEVGDTVYAIYAVYSTGDSFGQDHGAQFEFISVHKNLELAKKNLEAVNAYQSGRNQKLVIEFDGGGKIERYVPWDGYFESLDYASMSKFTVQKI